MLLLAPDLLGESLALKLTSARDDWEVVLRPERLTGAPALVIWSIDTVASLASLQHELFALQERWQPAPVLLLLPSEVRLSREQLLELPAAGLLQNVDAQGLQNAIETLLQGGRDIRLEAASESQGQEQTMGLGQWLLVSGLQQVSRDLQGVEALLNPPPEQPLLFLLLQATHQQPLPQAHGLLLAWRLRRSLQTNVPSALQQGFDGVLQALGINVLQQAGRRQLQQLFPGQA